MWRLKRAYRRFQNADSVFEEWVNGWNWICGLEKIKWTTFIG